MQIKFTDWTPILKWLPEYQRAWLARDLIAGATAWAVLVPLALAYAEIVGVEPVVGLYTIPLALLGYAIFGGSRLLVVGPDAAVAVLSAGVIATVAVGAEQYLAMTIALALIVAVLYVLFSFLKMGWIADLLPDPVLKGFIEGVVWVTILKQVPGLLGLEGSFGGFFRTLVSIAQTLPEAHVATTLASVASILALVLIRRFVPRAPGPLIVLVGAIVLVKLLGLESAGVAVLGEFSSGSFEIGLPSGLNTTQLMALVPGALAIVILGYTKTVGALKRAAEHSGEQIDPDRELLAMGVANAGAGLGGGYAIAGSLTATAVSIDTGGKSQVAYLFTGILCALTIVFLLPMLTDLAMCSLAAIIVIAMAGLSDVGYFRRLWQINRVEFAIGILAFAGVLVFDVVTGVAIGVVLALFNLAHHVHDPATTVVGRIPSGAFVDINEHPDAEEIPGLIIWRHYAPLVFLNARVLCNRIRALTGSREGLRVVVLDASASQGIDSSAANALTALRDELAADGIDVWVVNPRQTGWSLVVSVLQARGVTVPPVFETLADAVAEFEKLS
jgi:high affinity sulfate transporter 1